MLKGGVEDDLLSYQERCLKDVPTEGAWRMYPKDVPVEGAW